MAQYYPYIYTITKVMLRWLAFDQAKLAKHADLSCEVIQEVLCKQPITECTAQHLLGAYYHLQSRIDSSSDLSK